MIVIISSHRRLDSLEEQILDDPGSHYLNYKVFQDNMLAEAWKEELLDGGFIEKEGEDDEHKLEQGEFLIRFEIKFEINIPEGHYSD